MSASSTRVLALVLGYYVASTVTSCLTKMVLDDFPRPITVSLVQQSMASIGGLVRVGSVSGAIREWRAALPVAAEDMWCTRQKQRERWEQHGGSRSSHHEKSPAAASGYIAVPGRLCTHTRDYSS